MPQQRHARRGEAVVVEIVSAPHTRQDGRAAVGGIDVVAPADLVQQTHEVEPGPDVLAAIATRPALAAADRQVDRAPVLAQLIRNLRAGATGPDHQHGAWRELRGVAVVPGRQLQDVRGQRRAQRRNPRMLERPGRHDHVARGDGSRRCPARGRWSARGSVRSPSCGCTDSARTLRRSGAWNAAA